MENKTVTCSICGNRFSVSSSQDSAVCPYCKNRIPLAEQAINTAFYDAASGRTVGSACIPEGWIAHGEISTVMQSMGHPITARIQADSKDGSSILFANTGEQFHQIKSGMMEWHSEGRFDERTKTPMRAFIPASIYLDQLVPAFTNGMPFSLQDSFPLPRKDLENIPAEKQRYLEEAANLFQNASADGSSVAIQNAYIDGLASIYTYSMNEQPRLLIIGAEIKALEYSYVSAGASLINGAIDLFKTSKERKGTGENQTSSSKLQSWIDFGMNGGLMGASNRRQYEKNQNPDSTAEFGHAKTIGTLSSYIDWEVTGVYGLLAPAPLTELTYNFYNQFVRSFQIDPSIPAEMQARTQQITQQMQFEQQQQFQQYQQIHAAQSAMTDRINQSYWDRSRAQDANRRAYQNRMDSQDRSREKFSEAIRGVNTYTRPDGSEVEYSNSADRVFMKNGDTSTMRSAGYGEDVPFGWSELKKKD